MYASWTAKEVQACHVMTSHSAVTEALHMLGSVQAAWQVTDLVNEDVRGTHSGCWLKCSRQHSCLAANTAPDVPEQRLCHRLQSRVSHCDACHNGALHACICHVHSPCAVQLDCHGSSLHIHSTTHVCCLHNLCSTNSSHVRLPTAA
jgi:hypothetical protein